MVTPATVPATPAAQPYGAYLPTYRDQKIAEMADYYDRGIFVVDERAVYLMQPTRPRVH